MWSVKRGQDRKSLRHGFVVRHLNVSKLRRPRPANDTAPSITAVLMGDPPPGRSALDQKRCDAR